MKEICDISKYLLVFISISLLSTMVFSDSECEDCWTPKLNFDLEDGGFVSTMIFISGHSHAISSASAELSKQQKENFFCRKDNNMSSQELIEILNSKLSGNVTSEQVTESIAQGLMEKYPCKSSVPRYLYDLNEDGIQDVSFYSYRQGLNLELVDRNFDKKIDEHHYYNKIDKRLGSTIDSDFDGCFETLIEYKNSSINVEAIDSNTDKIYDIFHFYEFGHRVKSLKYYQDYEGKPAIGTVTYKFEYPSKELIEKTQLSQEQFKDKWCRICNLEHYIKSLDEKGNIREDIYDKKTEEK